MATNPGGNGKQDYRQSLSKAVVNHLFILLSILSLLIAVPDGAHAGTVKNAAQTYDSLSAAYTLAANGDILQAQAITFNEGLFLNRGIGITLRCGYDPAFSSNKSGHTTMAAPWSSAPAGSLSTG